MGGEACEAAGVPDDLLGEDSGGEVAVPAEGVAEAVAAIVLAVEVHGIENAVGVEDDHVVDLQFDGLHVEIQRRFDADDHAAGVEL